LLRIYGPDASIERYIGAYGDAGSQDADHDDKGVARVERSHSR
jgi:hypothetical protein